MSAEDPCNDTVLACILPDRIAPAQAEVFLRFSPRIALRAREPWAVLLDLRGIRSPRLPLKIRAALQRLGIDARVGLAAASTPGEALLDALGPGGGPHRRDDHGPDRGPDHGDNRRIGDPGFQLDARSIDLLLDPFGLQPASRELTAWCTLLEQLGICTPGELARLPLAALGSRFGRKGVELARRLETGRHEALPDLWPVFTPPQKITEELQFAPDQEALAAYEPLLFLTRPLLDRLCLRLRARARRLQSLALSFEIGRRTHSSRLTLAQAQGSLAGLLPLFQEHLQRQMDSGAGGIGSADDSGAFAAEGTHCVSRITIEVLETAPGLSGQRDLFDRIDELSESWDSLIGRLQQRLGPDAPFFAHPTRQHLPERGWKPAKPEQLPLGPQVQPPALLTPAPSRLLKRTVRLRFDGSHLEWPAKKPGSSTAPKRLKVIEVEGPERITPPVQTAGTQATAQERLYYRIRCLEGPLLWAYTHDEGPFESLQGVLLHGYFD
jgi:hypothetical protein